MYVVRLRHSVPQALQISRSSASTEWNSVALHGRHNERSAGRGDSRGRSSTVLDDAASSWLRSAPPFLSAKTRLRGTDQLSSACAEADRDGGSLESTPAFSPDSGSHSQRPPRVRRRCGPTQYWHSVLFPAALVEDALPRTHHNPQRINSVSGLPRQRKSIAVGARHGASAASLTSTVTVRYRAFGARFGSGIDRSTRSTPLHTPTDS